MSRINETAYIKSVLPYLRLREKIVRGKVKLIWRGTRNGGKNFFTSFLSGDFKVFSIFLYTALYTLYEWKYQGK